MNIILTLIQKIFARLASQETPFLLKEAETLILLGKEAISIELDTTLSDEEKKHELSLSGVALKTIVQAALSEGKTIGDETVSILVDAMGGTVLTDLGLSK